MLALYVSEIDACYLLACNRFFFNGVLSSVKISFLFEQVVNMNQINLVMYIYFFISSQYATEVDATY